MGLFNHKTPINTPNVLTPTPVEKSLILGAGLELIPLVSEKSARLNSIGQYTFKVRPGVSKTVIKKTIENLYKVRVIGINSVRLPRKTVRRGKIRGKQKIRCHVIVRLAKGQTLENAKV